jgi:lysophospholipase L1-like esterase
LWLCAAGALLLGSIAAKGALADEPARPQRIAFIGDSITDGFTYPLLIQQALGEAGRSVPTCIDAGVASDTAQLMRQRLDRDVLTRRPTLATLSVGVNDVNRGVPLDEFERDVRAIAKELKDRGIPLVVMTTSVLGPKLADADKRLDDYNAVLRRIAKEHSYPIAEVNETMRQFRGERQELLEADQIHLSFEGYRVMTRALLDALGHADVPVPAKQKLEPMPGIVRNWRLLAAADDKPLDEAQARSIAPDDSWKPYDLPEPKPKDHWWPEQERQRGFAMSLADFAAGNDPAKPPRRFLATSTIEADAPRKVYFNTGANLQAIWLNGKRIFAQEGFTGWHAGKERIPAELQQGQNVILIESGNEFFLSITDNDTW